MTLNDTQTPAPDQTSETRVQVLLRTKVKKPTVTYVLLAVTILMYAAQFISQWLLGGSDLPLIFGAKINDFILRGQVWRLVTPVFLHGSFLHMAFNMYALFAIGPSLEKFYGHKRFLCLYLLGGYAGNVLSFLLSTSTSLGASTAIFGLVAAQAVFILKNRKMFGTRARSMLINLVLVLLVNLSLGLSPNSRIDNWGHLGGLLGGLAFAWLSGPVYQVQPMPSGGFELVDGKTTRQILWGGVITIVIFSVAAAIRYLIQ